MVEKLLALTVIMNAADVEGRTALHYAAHKGAPCHMIFPLPGFDVKCNVHCAVTYHLTCHILCNMIVTQQEAQAGEHVQSSSHAMQLPLQACNAA